MIFHLSVEPRDHCIHYMRKGIESFLESLEKGFGSKVRILNDQGMLFPC
jgi:hypothetical protein